MYEYREPGDIKPGVVGRAPALSDRVRFGPKATTIDAPLSGFGYDTMRPGGRSALGNARVLAVLVEYDGLPPLTRSREWYANLVGRLGGQPPFGPDNPGSLLGYFAENSEHRFRPLRWNLVGPLRMRAPSATDMGDSGGRAKRILEEAVRQNRLDLDQLDDDGDGDVGVDELLLVTVENIPGLGAANRAVNEITTPRGRKVTVRCAFLGAGSSFTLFAHELAHSLGALDLYGWPQGKSARLTLMSQSVGGTGDDQVACHLDPWHKLVLGWSEPRVFASSARGHVVLRGVNHASAPIIVTRPDRPLEFYLVEFRRARSDLQVGYESWVPGTGVAIWHVRTSAPGVPLLQPSSDPRFAEYAVMHVGAPTGVRGTSTLWGAGNWVGLGWTGEFASCGIHTLEVAEDRAVIRITESSPPQSGAGRPPDPR
ncbi:MAG: hypothetical protein ACRCZD_05330 [Phycicoccus sp.]